MCVRECASVCVRVCACASVRVCVCAVFFYSMFNFFLVNVLQ